MARGRTPKIYSVIQDKALGKYAILKDDTQYTVVLKDNHQKQLSYHTQLNSALKSISEVRMSEKGNLTLKEYMSEYKRMLEEFKQVVCI